MLAGPTPLGPSAYGKDSNSRRHFVECDDGAMLERLAMNPQRSDDIVPNGAATFHEVTELSPSRS